MLDACRRCFRPYLLLSRHRRLVWEQVDPGGRLYSLRPSCGFLRKLDFCGRSCNDVLMIVKIAVLTQYRAVVGAPTPFGSNCQLQPMVSWAPICFAMSVAFDSIMLILVIAKLPSRLSQKSRIAHIFYRDSLLYFLATTTTNIIIMAIVAQGDSFSYIKAVSIPWNTVITYAMGTRTYLHLKMSKEQEMTPSVARLLPSQYGGASLSTQSQTHTIPSFPTPRSPPVSAYPNPRKEFAPMTLPVSVTKERSNPVDCL